MRIARFAAGDEVSYGLVGTAREGSATSPGVAPGGEIIAELAGHPFGGRDSIRLTGTTYPLADVRLLAPVLPSKVIGFAKAGPAGGSGTADGLGDGSVMYLKPSTAVCGPADPVQYPAGLARRVVAQGALAVVIGRLCRQVPPDQAAAVIFGYTCAADITARDLEERDGQWARARGFDTFCPLGPWIETALDASDLALRTELDGEVRQDSRTSLLLHDVGAIIEWITRVMTLRPGDVILTGTPAGVGPMTAGQTVSVTIEGIGTLTNKVNKGD